MKNNFDANIGGKSKKRITHILIILVSLVFIGRLAQLQIIKGSEYKLESEAQAIKKVRQEPFRGKIYDKNSNLIVQNAPSISLSMTMIDFDTNTIPLLASLLEISTQELKEIIDNYKGYSPFTPIKFYRNIDKKILANIEENIDLLPGIDIVIESKRIYETDVNFSHLLGYTREINKLQLENMPGYRPGDVIGQNGIEKEYEEYLRGQNGYKIVAVNNFGQKVSSFADGSKDIGARNGFDLFLSIDRDLQQFVESLLEGKRGAVVGIDPQTGEVIFLVSKPDFDLERFSGKISSEFYNDLINNEDKPMINRALSSQYPPGSTWKMLIAIAGMNEGIINENSTYYCGGSYFDGSRERACHGAHGNINVRNALKYSCNTFFYKLGQDIGYDNFKKYGEMFNFGSITGIDLPNEKPGILPTREWLISRFGENGASKGKLINFGIGQGEILTTPLQMAAYTAAIANDGIYYKPHLAKGIFNNVTDTIEYFDLEFRELKINKNVLKNIKNGMSDVVNKPGGTARVAQHDSVEVCGKTGTAQNPHGKNHAWFVAFAPKENPQIALCVFVENSGYGGAVAAPLAKKILDKFFQPKLDTIPRARKIDSTKIATN